MKTLYIIGNGFDRAHDMETSYGHFHKWLYKQGKKYMRAAYFADSIDVAQNGKSLWKQFEEGMGIINLRKYIKEITEDYNTDFGDEIAKSDAFYAEMEYNVKMSYKELIEAFRSWAKNLNTDYYEPEYGYINQGDNYFFTFNYTDTLENVYGIAPNRVMHIHGYSKDPKSTIQVGHTHHYEDNRDEIIAILDELLPADCGDSCDKLIEALNTSIKPVKDIIRANDVYFRDLAALRIDKIVIQGHGYGEIDMPYFEKIKSVCPNAQWELTWFSKDDELNANNMNKMLGLNATFREI